MNTRPGIVIVGRTNVGKSSLFNRLLGRRAAVVSDRPGVTRDRHFAEWDFDGRYVDIVDTGGFIDEAEDPLAEQVRAQITCAIEQATIVLFMIDAQTGVTKEDMMFARQIKRAGVQAILVANKSEKATDREAHYEWLQLGLGEAFPISAKTGYGIDSLKVKLRTALPDVGRPAPREESETLRLAILGRPNTGKSTLVNRLLGEERVIVSPIAGTTRDSIDSEFVWENRRIVLTDTAGLRKKAKVHDEVEYFSNMRTVESIRRSHVVILLADSLAGLEEQDLRILRLCEEAGKGLIIGLNKWDIVEKDHRTFDEMVKEARYRIPSIENVPILSFSGLTGQRVPRMLEVAAKVRDSCRMIFGRERVIEYFRDTVERQPPPSVGAKTIRIKRCCQVHVDPPVLAFETDHADIVPESYRRFLRYRAQDFFDLLGVPLRISFRTKLELRSDDDLARFSA